MAWRVPLQTIITVRGGQRIVIPPGKAHNFPEDELEHLEAWPNTVRRVMDESAGVGPLPAGPDSAAQTAHRAALAAAVRKEAGPGSLDDAADL